LLKFLNDRSNFKVRKSKIIVPVERSFHKEHTILSLAIQGMTNVKVFADRKTDRPKTICMHPRSFDTGA
jgi:hypothetical protein